MRRENLRNVAVIAHVDHGKTTLIDGMLFEAHLFREGETVRERFLDSGDLERERGITITAKHVTVEHGGVKINIIDTPGHADFGGEVERVLKMADGVFLLVDAFDGPMPQTRFVLRKALELDLKAIVVINKIDRSDARPAEVLNEVFDLFVDLNASEEQLEFPVVYASGRDRVATLDLALPGKDLSALFQAILDHVPPPLGDVGAPLSMQVTSIGYDSYVGRIGIGRVFAGRLLKKTPVALVRQRTGERETHVIRALYAYRGIEKIGEDVSEAGDIAAVVGIPTVEIGDTIADAENPVALPPIHVEEPTIHMLFRTNDSPFYGRDGHHVQGRKLRERLYQELEKNVALRIEDTAEPDAWNVAGRGVLHLGILIETVRREGYELAVGRPKVIFKEVDGGRHEPIETVIVDCAEKFTGKMIELLGGRRGELHHMDRKGDFVHMEFR
ncbi:MAG: GTP-binding protein, partial [Planctomycetes bacterium]|nr:GTP-binding protein [Planctomycetota bacterium]